MNGSLQKRKNEARYVDTRPIIETGISELVPNIIDKPGPTRQIILQPEPSPRTRTSPKETKNVRHHKESAVHVQNLALPTVPSVTD